MPISIIMAQLMLAETISQLGTEAFKPGGLVTTAYDSILGIVNQHKTQLEAKRALVGQIRELDKKIQEQRRWLSDAKIPIPKEGSGIVDQIAGVIPGISDWIKAKSKAGHEARQIKRMDIILAKSNYLAKLTDLRNQVQKARIGAGVPVVGVPAPRIPINPAPKKRPVRKISDIERRLQAVEKKVK